MLYIISCVFIVALYIPPDENSKNALQELCNVMSSNMTTHPDGIFMVAGNFNIIELRSA